MKEYLENRIGQKLSVTRAGFPQEVHFEASLEGLIGQVAVFRDKDGNEVALPMDKIILVGPPGDKDETGRKKPGFK